VFGILESGNLLKGHLGEAKLFVKYDVFSDGSVQFILFTAALFDMLVFGRKKFVEWKLAIFMGILIGISAITGGYFSRYKVYRRKMA
jgi:hypothetical protein